MYQLIMYKYVNRQCLNLDYTFFKNFEPMQLLNSVRPGRSIGDPVVNDIKG